MQKDPYDVVAEAREIKRRMSREAGNDVFKLGEMIRKRAKEHGIVYSKRPPVNSPGIRRLIAEVEELEAARRAKIDAYLARRTARNQLAKSA